MVRFFSKLIFVYVTLFALACTGRTESSEPNKTTDSQNKIVNDPVSFKLFTNPDHTYGFDITLNGKAYIHQPFIPAKQGMTGFMTKQAAESVAALTTERLKNQDYRFLITEAEINTVLQTEKIPVSHTAQINTVQINLAALSQNQKSVSPQHDYTTVALQIPVLPNAPIKSQWRSIGVLPFGKRLAAFSFSIDDFVFVGGGQLKDEMTNDFWCYNVVTGVWTCLAVIPGGIRISGVAFAIGKKGFIGLGNNGSVITNSFKKDLYEYNPAENKWSGKRDFIGSARVDASAFVIRDKAYVGSGHSKDYCSDFYEYDPAKDKWKRIADFGGGPVSASIGISTGNHGFLVAGDRVPENKRFVYEYLPGENKWQKQRDFPGHPRYFLTGCNIDSNLFIAGSGGAEGGDIRFRDFFRYNIAQDNWSKMPDYLSTKAGNARPCIANVKGDIYVGGGFNGVYLNDWNVYEYYFPVRKDTGVYNENVCYPLKYNGTWELYQECMGEVCYAGAAIKSSKTLGEFCYSSLVSTRYNQLAIKSNTNAILKFILLPRYFALSTEKTPSKQIDIRLFYTHEEIEGLAEQFRKITGKDFTIDKIKILQYNGRQPDLNPLNDNSYLSNYNIISPQLFGYGFQQRTIVTEFATPALHSEFYLAIQVSATL